MNKEIRLKFEEFIDSLKKYADEHTTAVSIFINSEETKIEFFTRTPEQLENAGISMRNLKGDFIKNGNGK